MRKIIILSTLLGFLALFPVTAHAANNKFGIHIISENDLEDAAKLVNGNNGEWGYVTMVIRDDEWDFQRWNKVMQKMKELKLIPIIRIATHIESDFWARPDINKAHEWALFLNSLDWPTKSRHVVIFNEPNHAKEWGGSISPEEYTVIARRYWEEFKKANPDFFVLPAALDQAAPNSSSTMSEESFLEKMFVEDELIFTIFDGWNSHSYPNPAFSGNPEETGKMSIKGFEWELGLLNKYWLYPGLPIFITETGWADNYLSDTKIAEFYKYAFEQVWNDDRIKAVTPFLLSHPMPPFNNFSWKNSNGEYSEQYYLVQSLYKEKGDPSL